VQLSVIIASKNRPELLAALLATLRPQIQLLDGRGEIVVVDDGSTPPYGGDQFPGVTLLQTSGVGPARARNFGVEHSGGEIILFTDDDVAVDDGWVVAALNFLDRHPTFAGVTGDTTSPPFSPIYEHSVEDHDGGSFLTCNVAYRREAFVSVGGFDRLFPHAAHEDRDLAWRIQKEVGPVGFEPGMRVVHPGRPFTAKQWRRRGVIAIDDWLVLARHPERKASQHSLRWAPLTGAAYRWRSIGRSVGAFRSPRKFRRWIWVAGGQLAVNAWTVASQWRYLNNRDARAVPGLRFPGWRIAYIGPSPNPHAGGAPGVAGLLLDQLLQRGHSIDVFVVASREDDDPYGLGVREGLNYVVERSNFAFEKWYSRNALTKMMSSQLFAARGRQRLAKRMRALHHATPYDFIYQFSSMESVGVPRNLNVPIIMHPSVHAQGERTWFDREYRTGVSVQPALKHFIVSRWLQLRSIRQSRDARRATGVLALSKHFGDAIIKDYAVDGNRVRVVPNCINVDEIAVGPGGRDVLVVGRLAVRKGLEVVARVTHAWVVDRKEEERDIRFQVIGNHSLWSDYRDTVRSSESSVTSLAGHKTRTEVFQALQSGLALLQLSRYEPFGLTVAEALASGVPVLVTDQVGASEEVSREVAFVVSTGLLESDSVLQELHRLASLNDSERLLLANHCRAEAERLFRPAVVADQFEAAVESLLAYSEQRS
jgi:glycosyltransferase involved in cell wall biosynthesis/GT2 family glycosyltransferase